MLNRAARPQAIVTALVALAAIAALSGTHQAQRSQAPAVTTPKEQFGHDIGDDYFLINYTQYVEYLKKLDQQSDRMVGRRDRQDGRRPSRADGHHHVARESQAACRSTRT